MTIRRWSSLRRSPPRPSSSSSYGAAAVVGRKKGQQKPLPTLRRRSTNRAGTGFLLVRLRQVRRSEQDQRLWWPVNSRRETHNEPITRRSSRTATLPSTKFARTEWCYGRRCGCEDAIVEAARRLKHPTRSAPQPNLVVHVAQATRPVEEPLEDGEDLGSGSLGPGERVDDRPISMLLPTNTDHDVDDLSGHVGR